MSTLNSEELYGEVEIKKHECVGHIQKRVTTNPDCWAVGAHEGVGEVEGNPGNLEVSLKQPKPPLKVKLLRRRLHKILQFIP